LPIETQRDNQDKNDFLKR